MNATLYEEAHSPLTGKTAADLMTPNPVSIDAAATVAEVVAFLTDTGYSAAPVIDDAGRPVGVVSRTDIVVYDRARTASATDGGQDSGQANLSPGGRGLLGQAADIRAADLMTPEVYGVAPDTDARDAAREMVRRNIHRLFVVDRDGVLVGVISALDLLRHLCGVT